MAPKAAKINMLRSPSKRNGPSTPEIRRARKAPSAASAQLVVKRSAIVTAGAPAPPCNQHLGRKRGQQIDRPSPEGHDEQNGEEDRVRQPQHRLRRVGGLEQEPDPGPK